MAGKAKGLKSGGVPSSEPSSPACRQPRAQSGASTSSSPRHRLPAPTGSPALSGSLRSSRTQDNEEASSSEAERPSKRHRRETSMKPMKGKGANEEVNSSRGTARPTVQDITVQALFGLEEDVNEPVPFSSAFGNFAPARPPVAHQSRYAFGSPSSLGFPRDQPPSLASARRWKMTQIQRHADSLAFFSRDQLQNRAELPDSSVGGLPDYAIRVDTFEETGSLMWVQAQCLDEKERVPDGRYIMDGNTFGHTQIDGAGRQRGQRRVLNSYVSYDSDEEWDDEEYFEHDLVKPQHSLSRSSIGLTPYAHPAYSTSPLYEVIQYDFDHDSTSLPRGLAMIPYDFPPDTDSPFLEEDDGGWTIYGKPNMFTTLSTPVRPSLHPWEACERMVRLWQKWVTQKPMDKRRGDELNLTVTLMETQAGLFFDAVHLAPVEANFPSVPVLPHHRFSSIAINEGTGHCWLGHADGSVEFVDMLWWIHTNWLTCPQWDDEESEEHGRDCTCNMEPIEPEQALPASEERGAVTNVVAVGGFEVVVAFSNGEVVLLELGNGLAISKTRNFVGHVSERVQVDNKGSSNVEMTVHTASRLMAIRGSDGQLRVWHLDDPYPLSSAWHRPRLAHQLAAPLNLLAQSSAQQSRSPTQQQHGDAASPSPSAEEKTDDTWDRLATQNVEEEAFAEIRGTRLASLHVQPFCSMTWASTSWLADRDGQWEMSRQFNDEGRPKVVSAGLLPGLVMCSDRPVGTTFLYFEPERREEISDAGVEVEEGQDEPGEAAIV